MNYKEVLRQIKPYKSLLTNKAYLCVEKDGIIKEKEEMDLDFWLLCLAEIKRQIIGSDVYELHYPQVGHKLKIEIEAEDEWI